MLEGGIHQGRGDRPASEQEPAQVLVTLLGVDLAERSGVRPVDVGPVRTAHVGIVHVDESVGLRAHRGTRRPSVVGRVGADQAEDILHGKYRRTYHLRVPALIAVLAEFLVRVQVPLHHFRREDLGAGRAERFFHPLGNAARGAYATVRRSVGEEPGYQLGGRPVILRLADLLDHAARYETAHRVRDYVDLVRRTRRVARPLDDLHDQVVEATGRRLDIEAVAGDLLVPQFPQPLDQVLVWLRREGRGGLIVEPVNPDRGGLGEIGGRVVEDSLLAAVDVDLITLVADQPDERALELVKCGRAIACHPDVSGPAVEPVEGVLDRTVDSRGRPAVPANVYDRQLIHRRPLKALARDKKAVLARRAKFVKGQRTF